MQVCVYVCAWQLLACTGRVRTNAAWSAELGAVRRINIVFMNCCGAAAARKRPSKSAGDGTALGWLRTPTRRVCPCARA